MSYVTINQAAQSLGLTLLDTVKREMVIDSTDDDQFITDLINEVSSAIPDYLDRTLAREFVTEGLESSGRTTLLTTRVPIVNLTQMTYKTDVIDPTLYFVSNPDAGIIYNPNGGWITTEIYGFPALFASELQPMPSPPNPSLYLATYSCGWLLPDDDISSNTGISFAASDSSINLASGAFPLLDAGDKIVVSGSVANSKTFIVVSATPTKIVVNAAVSTEVAGPEINIAVRNLPYAIERAAIVTIKGWYFGRDRDWATQMERIGTPRAGGWQANYVADDAFPPEAKRLLAKYRLNV